MKMTSRTWLRIALAFVLLCGHSPVWSQESPSSPSRSLAQSLQRQSPKSQLHRSKLWQEFLEQEQNKDARQAARWDVAAPKDWNQIAQRTPAGSQAQASAMRATSGNIELSIDYAVHTIGRDQVRLRSYNGQLVGPVIRAKAGDTLNITLRNRLPVEPSTGHDLNEHHDWNTTNLHFHGLHVAPQGTSAAESDNVLLELKPSSDPNGSVQQYAVQIPATHPAGTFWYHAHKHGSTAAQVSSGMAGALIIERDDNQLNLNAVPEIAAASIKEEVMVLQQIPYLKPAGTQFGFIELSGDGSTDNAGAMFGPAAWSGLRRYVTVNGQRIPKITLAPGEVRRLRLIHSGQRQELALQIVRDPSVSGADPAAIQFHEIAVDGLPLGEVRTKNRLNLFPGYRSDVLIQPGVGATGQYNLIDANGSALTGADGSTESLRLVARIEVAGTPVNMSLPSSSAVAPHRLPLLDESLATSTQHAYYGIAAGQFNISRAPLAPGQVAASQEFDPTDSRNLIVDTTERWQVGSRNAGINVTHPFHIHINPFFVQEVRNASNVDVTMAELGGPTWRDTLAMKQGFTYKLLTRYERFTGSFVDHCHILDHEDLGMMELVTIQPATGPAIPPGSPNAILTALPQPSEGKSQALFFVKGSFCPHCMEQLTSIVPQLAQRKCDIIVVTASAKEDLAKFPVLPYQLLADPQMDIFKRLKIVNANTAQHGTLVFSPSGKEVFRNVGEAPFTDLPVLLNALESTAIQLEFRVRLSDVTSDDYITWSPAKCSVRIVNGTATDPPVQITLTNDNPTTNPQGGNVAFASSLQPNQTASAPSVTLNLHQDGTPVEFIIAGTKASELTTASLALGGRDAFIEAHAGDASGPVIGSHAVMVRVRKDAVRLNALERFELLKTFASIKGDGTYERLVDLHTLATGFSSGQNWPDQAHRGPGFLPWHRAFLLHFERVLQSRSPHVALSYWREDTVTNLFEPNFIGSNSILAGGALVTVNLGSLLDPQPNPLLGWNIGGAALRRRAIDRADTSWCRAQSLVIAPDNFLETSSSFAPGLENNPHNRGHGRVGGWMGNCSESPRDPIFFFFHTDIDRLWARWQWEHNRFAIDGINPKVYFPNDAYAAGSADALGHHLKDTLWPWNMLHGPAAPADPNDDRPPSNPESPFPISPLPGIWNTDAKGPTVATMIDYLSSAGGQDLGFCYDDSGFGSKPASVVTPLENLIAAVDMAHDKSQPFNKRIDALARLPQSDSASLDEKLLLIFKDNTQADQIRAEAFRAANGANKAVWVTSALESIQSSERAGDSLRAELIEQVGIVSMFNREGHHRREEIQQRLSQLLTESESPAIRHAVLSSLAVNPSAQTLQWLRNALLNRDERLVSRQQAVDLLATAAPGQNVDVLRELLSAKESNPVRISTLLALGEDRGSLGRRREMATDRALAFEVREAALRSLLSDHDFATLAIDLLANPDEQLSIRQAAVAATGLHLNYKGAQLTVAELNKLRSRILEVQNQSPTLASTMLPMLTMVDQLIARK